jgi:hypothetical protein
LATKRVGDLIKETYPAITVAAILIANTLVAEVYTEFATHDFVVV